VKKSNPITALDAAIALLFYVARQGRGASEFQRWQEEQNDANTI
jgi:hypothetical protein